jgi:pantetheine-phosphate adenylyltransferase
MFTVNERVDMIERRFTGDTRIKVVSYSDMTVDCCRREGAGFILRGVRDTKDFEYEQTVAAVNRLQDPSIETLLLMADPEHIDISSTLEREKLTHNQHLS